MLLQVKPEHVREQTFRKGKTQMDTDRSEDKERTYFGDLKLIPHRCTFGERYFCKLAYIVSESR